VERIRKSSLVAVVVLLLFLWLGREVRGNRTLAFDTAVRGTVHGWASVPLTWLMVGTTQLGAPWVLIVVTLLAGWRFSVKGHRRVAAVLAISTIGVAALEESLKTVYQRIRPVAFFGYDEPMTYSFPSGHATTCLCFYGLLAVIVTQWIASPRRRRIVWIITVLLVALIGFSRVYLGVHYPTDVLGGYALGAAWIIGVVRIASPIGGKPLRPS